jgi:hypothetical protein
MASRSAGIVLSAILAGGIAFGIYQTGVLLKWEGSYSGIVRPSGQSGSVNVLVNPQEGTVLVLRAPDLPGGSCTSAFERSGRQMDAKSSEKCGPFLVGIGSLSLDGDSLSAALTFYRVDAKGMPDFEHETRLNFLGTRTANATPTGLPAIFGGSASPRLPDLSKYDLSDTDMPPSRPSRHSGPGSSPPAKGVGNCELSCLDCTAECFTKDPNNDACGFHCALALRHCCENAGTVPKSSDCGCE